jgi:hypothetical protein
MYDARVPWNRRLELALAQVADRTLEKWREQ